MYTNIILIHTINNVLRKFLHLCFLLTRQDTTSSTLIYKFYNAFSLSIHYTNQGINLKCIGFNVRMIVPMLHGNKGLTWAHHAHILSKMSLGFILHSKVQQTQFPSNLPKQGKCKYTHMFKYKSNIKRLTWKDNQIFRRYV